MRRNLAVAGACLLVLCGGDFVWLGVVGRAFYASRLGALLLAEPRWPPAVLFYLLYACGLVVFCVNPALAARSWRKGVALGAFFGLVAYATYDLSNLATLEGWPASVACVDIAWGSLLSAAATLAGYAAGAALAR
jgi:uncharacterized membrane protein